MILIIGLGNPGTQFIGTRHNTGREVAEAFQKETEVSDFRFEKKWNARVSEGKLGKERVVVLLPETMMNKSGTAVAHAVRFYNIRPKNVCVVHDDADIALGRTKLTFGRRSAGHRGVESVKRALGTWEFWRLRIGIQKKKRIDAMKLVLQKFTPTEMAVFKKTRKKLVNGIEQIVTDGPERAMNEVNRG